MATTRCVPTRSPAWGAAFQNTRQAPDLCSGQRPCTPPRGRCNQNSLTTPTVTPWAPPVPARRTTPPTSGFSLQRTYTVGQPTSQLPIAGLSPATSSRAATRKPRAVTSNLTKPAKLRAAPVSPTLPCLSSLTMGALLNSACRPTYDGTPPLLDSFHLQRERNGSGHSLRGNWFQRGQS